MPTRNVVLTEHQAGFVEDLVAGGRYQNAREVLREGLRLIEQRDAEQAARIQVFRDAVRQRGSDIAAGHAFRPRRVPAHAPKAGAAPAPLALVRDRGIELGTGPDANTPVSAPS